MIIFVASLMIWFMLAPNYSLDNIVFGVAISFVSLYFSRRMLPRGNSLKATIRILLNYPAALFQSITLVFRKPNFTAYETEVPENRIDEFAKIISVTLTPEEIVVMKENDKLVVHGVKK
ncbi:MAG: Na+/H+ antiporter subunit E [Kosmotogaceae bacterium]